MSCRPDQCGEAIFIGTAPVQSWRLALNDSFKVLGPEGAGAESSGRMSETTRDQACKLAELPNHLQTAGITEKGLILELSGQPECSFTAVASRKFR